MNLVIIHSRIGSVAEAFPNQISGNSQEDGQAGKTVSHQPLGKSSLARRIDPRLP
jgi:hypothetical protein